MVGFTPTQEGGRLTLKTPSKVRRRLPRARKVALFPARARIAVVTERVDELSLLNMKYKLNQSLCPAAVVNYNCSTIWSCGKLHIETKVMVLFSLTYFGPRKILQTFDKRISVDDGRDGESPCCGHTAGRGSP